MTDFTIEGSPEFDEAMKDLMIRKMRNHIEMHAHMTKFKVILEDILGNPTFPDRDKGFFTSILKDVSRAISDWEDLRRDDQKVVQYFEAARKKQKPINPCAYED